MRQGEILSGDHMMLEGGHMIVMPNGRQCGCGQRGCLEAYCSAPAVVTRALEMLASEVESSLRSLDGAPSCKDIFEHAKQGDPLAQQVVEEVSEWLAFGVINLARVLDPSVVVFSGGVAEAGQQLLHLTSKYVKRHTWKVLPTHTRLECALVGAAVAGLVGAAAAVREETRRSESTSMEKIRIKQNEHKALQARDTRIQFRQQSSAQAAATKAANDRYTAVRRKAAEQADQLKSDQQQNQNRPPRGRDSKRGKAVHTQITATLLLTLSPGEIQDTDLCNAQITHHNRLINRIVTLHAENVSLKAERQRLLLRKRGYYSALHNQQASSSNQKRRSRNF